MKSPLMKLISLSTTFQIWYILNAIDLSIARSICSLVVLGWIPIKAEHAELSLIGVFKPLNAGIKCRSIKKIWF